MPVNVRYVFEGEEESSSVHLDAWLEANRERLAADVAIISDSGFFEGNLPAITLSLRGMMYAQIDVVGTAVDLHSGGFGGAVQNPANALAQIIAGLKGPDGRIRIPGFYDDVVALSDDDRAALAALPFDEAAYLRRLGLPALVGEAGFTTLERRAIRPTLDVNGIWGGFQGEGSKTIIPAHAHAKVSCRLVADQDPDTIFEAFRAYVEEIAPPGVTTTVRYLGGGHPSLTPIDHPADPGRRPGARGDVRAGAGLHPRGRLDPGLRQLRVASSACRSSSSASPRRTTTPTRRTSGWTSATTRPASARSPGCSTSWSICRVDAASPRRLCGFGGFGWVIRALPGATLWRPHQSGRNRPREHRRSREPTHRQARRRGASTPPTAA